MAIEIVWASANHDGFTAACKDAVVREAVAAGVEVCGDIHSIKLRPWRPPPGSWRKRPDRLPVESLPGRS